MKSKKESRTHKISDIPRTASQIGDKKDRVAETQKVRPQPQLAIKKSRKVTDPSPPRYENERVTENHSILFALIAKITSETLLSLVPKSVRVPLIKLENLKTVGGHISSEIVRVIVANKVRENVIAQRKVTAIPLLAS